MHVVRGITVSLIVAFVGIASEATTKLCPCNVEFWKQFFEDKRNNVESSIDELKLEVTELETEVAKVNDQAVLECRSPFKLVGGKTCLMLLQWESGTWEESRSVCRDLGSDLAVFLNRTAFYSALQFLSSYGQLPYHVWVGLQRDTTTSTWKWTTGDEFASDSPLWAQDEPRDGTEKGYLLCHGVWKLNATRATETSYPLCQKEATKLLTDPQEPTSLNK